MLPPDSQGQYGGNQTPAVTTPGGASMASNLGSAALGMFTGGASSLVGGAVQLGQAALADPASNQTQTYTGAPQSTGSKVFNLNSAAGAVNANPFWSGALGGNSAIVPILLLGGIAVLVFCFVLRRR